MSDTYNNALKFYLEQLPTFSLAKGKVHSKSTKQALDKFIAPSTGFLKLLIFIYALHTPTDIILYFYFAQIHSVSLALRPGHFKVAGIPFYIQIPRPFLNSANEDYKNQSHGK